MRYQMLMVIINRELIKYKAHSEEANDTLENITIFFCIVPICFSEFPLMSEDFVENRFRLKYLYMLSPIFNMSYFYDKQTFIMNSNRFYPI